MNRLVFVTQVLDPDDEVLGSVPNYLQALASRVDRLVVIANEVRSIPYDFDAEVVSLGKEKGLSRVRRTLRYEAALARVLSRRGRTALVAHMCPIYLTLAAPLALVTKSRTLLWYAHSADSASLRLAERLAGAVLTTAPGSYHRSSEKIRPIGQGIDIRQFSYSSPTTTSSALRLLTVGRTSPDKCLPTIIRACSLARSRGTDVRLRIVGRSLLPKEQEHRAELEDLVRRLGLGSVVTVEPGVPYEMMPSLLRQASAVVSAAKDGSADKTIFEAAACGRLVLAASSAFESLLRDLPLKLNFAADDADELADRMTELAGASASWLELIGKELCERVTREHSNEHWAAEVVSVAEGLLESQTMRDAPA